MVLRLGRKKVVQRNLNSYCNTGIALSIKIYLNLILVLILPNFFLFHLIKLSIPNLIFNYFIRGFWKNPEIRLDVLIIISDVFRISQIDNINAFVPDLV